MTQQSRFAVLVVGQHLDILVVDCNPLERPLALNFAMNLTNILYPDELEALNKLNIINFSNYYEANIIGKVADIYKNIPLGVSLKYNQFFKNLHPCFTNWTLIILPNSQNLDMIREFLEYIDII